MCPLSQEFTLFWTAAGLLLAAVAVALVAVLRPDRHQSSDFGEDPELGAEDDLSVPRLAPSKPLKGSAPGGSTGVFWALLGGGLAFQTLALYVRGDWRGQLPVTNPFETLQAIVWVTMVLTVLLRASLPVGLLTLFGCGLSALLSVVALAMPHWDDSAAAHGTGLAAGAAASPWVSLHVWLAVVAYGMFAVLTATSAMYLLQHYSLKRGWWGAFFAKLPSVRLLEGFNQRLLLAGWLVLTLAVLLGLLNMIAVPGGVGGVKLAVVTLLWGSYLALYRLRQRGTLRASQFAGGSVGVFLIAVLALWPLTNRPNEGGPWAGPIGGEVGAGEHFESPQAQPEVDGLTDGDGPREPSSPVGPGQP